MTKQDDRAKAREDAEAKRKADVTAAIERMDDVEVGLFAEKNGVDLAGLSTRVDKVAAIELKLDADAKAAADAAAIADIEADQADDIAAEDDGRDATARIIRRLNSEFCGDVPQAAREGGYEPDEGGAFSGEYPVKDGRYRVVGSEWLFDFKKKRLVSANRASAANKFGGKGVIPIH